ncbi:zinc finger BED domain-containing protein RICESLEEPER 2-like [Spinacia oleracea]|uniref:Zinc finger BED domain-containing protein RICESLEEPER 2-like n=1 Tax=Spinacia oleracea TaxID=3562 RepID=A0A9R0JSU0_SPIOL|nr:zinc finger BED domain-containing protein RICESLEEPER 2-like [Spinacia oleracea]
MRSSDLFMQRMATKMNEKFGKYWSQFSTFMAVAVVLDPRFKIQFVEWSFKKVYGEGLEFEIEFSKVKDAIKTLYEAYVASYSSSHNSGSAVQGEGGRAVDASSGNWDELMDFDSFTNEQSNVAVKSEIQMYYEEPLIPRANKLDILNHWRACAVRYPILSTLAKDVLAVPVSTVALESIFSTGSRVLDCIRSSLSTTTLESIICLKDWTFGVVTLEPQIEALCGSVTNLRVNVEGDESPLPMSPAIEAHRPSSSNNI